MTTPKLHLLTTLIVTACLSFFIAESTAQQTPADAKAAQAQTTQAQPKAEKPKNLKVLPKRLSGEEVHDIMRGWSKSLGVRCTFCHVGEEIKPTKEGEKPSMKFDFPSDKKPEKNIARAMYRMTGDINKKYLAKIKNLEFDQPIACVTCHMGKPSPMTSVDSLPQKAKQ